MIAAAPGGAVRAVPAPPGRERAAGAGERDGAGEMAALRQRLLVSAALAVPVVALAMIPPLQFRNWQWACLALASPVAGSAARHDMAMPERR
jgi:P-type Cu+ transporter